MLVRACRCLSHAIFFAVVGVCCSSICEADALQECIDACKRQDWDIAITKGEQACRERNDAHSYSWCGLAYAGKAFSDLVRDDWKTRERLLGLAVTRFEKAADLRRPKGSTDNERAWSAKCKTYMGAAACARGDYDRAIDVLTRTRRDSGDSHELEFFLGQAYRGKWKRAPSTLEEKRLRDLAIAAYETCIRLDPAGRYAEESRQGLDELRGRSPGNPRLILTGHADEITVVAVTPDGRRAVSGSLDGTLRVWDLETGQFLHELTGHTSRVSALAVTPDGSRAVSGSWDCTIRVWDLNTGRSLSVSRCGPGVNTVHVNHVTGVATLPDGLRAVSASNDGRVKVWDLQTGACVLTGDVEGAVSAIRALAISPDGRLAVCGHEDKAVRVWDLQTGALLHQLTGHDNWVKAVAITPDGRRAVSGTYGTIYGEPPTPPPDVRVWDLVSGRCLHILQGHKVIISALAIMPDGQRAVSGAEDQTLKIWDLESGLCLHTLSGHEGMIYGVAVLDERRVISASGDGTAKVWDTNTGTNVTTLRYHQGAITTLALTPDRRQLVCGSRDRSLTVWDLSQIP